MPKVIFISGIHASGKTTLGKNLSKKLHFPFDSASNIIKKASTQNWDKEKRVGDIGKNQNVLLEGIKNLYSLDEIIILDGHFTLLDKYKNISSIPLETFQNLNLHTVITCIASPENIIARLKERDGNTNVDAKTISNFQDAEINYAKKVSDKLEIPIIFYDPTKQELEDLIKKIV